jgi:hypothetical protein
MPPAKHVLAVGAALVPVAALATEAAQTLRVASLLLEQFTRPGIRMSLSL